MTAVADLKVDQELPILGLQYTDENGNPTDAPAGAVEEFTSSDPAVVSAVFAESDGQLVARAVGLPGQTATITATSTWTDADGVSQSIEPISVGIALVTGDTQGATINFGPAREITPDV
jgi:hypothetical protein